MFASQSLTIHVLRGIGGFAALGLAIVTIQFIWPVFVLIPLGLFLLRGCPMCWTMGLLETINRSVQKRTSDASTPFCSECVIKVKQP